MHPIIGFLKLTAFSGVKNQIDHFSINLPFTLDDEVITIADGVWYGDIWRSIFSGEIKYQENSLLLDGIHTRDNIFNKAAGKLPVVGILFRSSDDENLFAIRYQLKGKISEPNLTFVPISYLLPGILGRIADSFANRGIRKR